MPPDPHSPGAASPSNKTAPPAGRARARAPLSTFAGSAEARVVVIGAAGDLHRALTHPAVESGRFVIATTVVVDVEAGLGQRAREQVERLFDQVAVDGILLAGPVGPAVVEWATDVALGHGGPLWAVMPTETPRSSRPRIVGRPSGQLVELTGDRRQLFTLGVKRTMDILGALVGLALIGPALALVSLLIRIESPGAPLFRHVRVARGGRRFGCLKLRTMYADAEERLEADASLYELYRANGYKIPEDADPRITPLGRFLRRSSLDELPQLWNVLVGDMSLVGPRPLVPEELEHYRGARRRLLLTVRPGLTGEWAVGGRHALSYPRRADVELAYVRRRSIGRDLSILVRTISAVRTY